MLNSNSLEEQRQNSLNAGQTSEDIHLFNATDLAPVVQRVDSTVHWINRYPADKCYQN